ncbi:integral membrane protein [Nannizzia gypsea CBS 118893]|uniref:Integral membrane protein n=1 Tax=Arthroderma gypseum (strain ATCC MYA-4604 / CBS 118893) TaxID=535722 RepID=E4V5C7_ARTGP|nr:integral membrane protein [Nannizzia gypsea CBS 118893]EFR05201.1 integral membrane protein [Nannizzia gypsea CBS 118893]
MNNLPRYIHAGQAPNSDHITVLIKGLQKVFPKSHKPGKKYQELLRLHKDTPIAEIWNELCSLGYSKPLELKRNNTKRWCKSDMITHFKPYQTVEVVSDESLSSESHIFIDEPLIANANRQVKLDFVIDKGINQPNQDVLHIGEALSVKFHRTLRMPDDDKLHHLPASLGPFPLYSVSEYAERLPAKIVNKGGVFLPMFQREAMWMDFDTLYPQKFALRVFVGKVNAISGKHMDETNDAKEPVQDYIVVPGQKWLDGICTSPGVVKQFVAMPLGSGYTVESQKTGEDRHGGLQIEVIPAYRTGLRKWYFDENQRVDEFFFDDGPFLDEQRTPAELGFKPGDKIRSYPADPIYHTPTTVQEMAKGTVGAKISVTAYYGMMLASASRREILRNLQSDEGLSCTVYGLPPSADSLLWGRPTYEEHGMGELAVQMEDLLDLSKAREVTPEQQNVAAMGLAAGGKLIQDIYRDSNPSTIWNTSAAQIVNVHFLDPFSCEKVTHIVPPPPPVDGAEYIKKGLPFFVVDEQVDNRVDGGDFNDVKSISTINAEKGITAEPSFDPNKPTIIRPCDHQFCNICIKKLEISRSSGDEGDSCWKCPRCGCDVAHVAGFAAPMNLPGEESLKAKVPVHVLKVEDGRAQFQSIRRMRV